MSRPSENLTAAYQRLFQPTWDIPDEWRVADVDPIPADIPSPSEERAMQQRSDNWTERCAS